MKVLLDRVKEDVKESGWPICEETGEKFKYLIIEPSSFGGEGRLIFSGSLKSGLLGSPFMRYGDYLKHLADRLKGVREISACLIECLPYADGESYYDDKVRIRELSEEISELKNLLSKEGVQYEEG